MPPASAMTVSPGSSSISTIWRSSPWISKSISCERLAGASGPAGSGGGAALTVRLAKRCASACPAGSHAAMPSVQTSVEGWRMPPVTRFGSSVSFALSRWVGVMV